MRAFYAFALMGFRQATAYKVEGWLGMLSSMIWFILFAGIWSALLKGDTAAFLTQMSYLIASRALNELYFMEVWEVGVKFRQGDVGLELVKPLALPIRMIARFAGSSIFRFARALPAFVLIWILYGLDAPDPGRLVLFLISGVFGWIILAAAHMSLALIALWTVQFNESDELFQLGLNLFSGSFIPLHYLPAPIALVAKYLPFAGIYYTPSAIMSGALSGSALWQGLGLQIFWAGALVMLLAAVWNAGSRKLVMQGG